jgi:hypothetical protein
MSRGTAVILMSLMIAGGVVGGNRNALSRAREPVSTRISQMGDRLDGMVAKANNYTALANAQGEDISEVARAQAAATEAAGQRASAEEIYTAANQLHQAVMDLNDRLDSPDKAKVYDDWMQSRVNYKDADSYNSAVEGLNKVYRAVPFRWLWGGYNYQPVSY